MSKEKDKPQLICSKCENQKMVERIETKKYGTLCIDCFADKLNGRVK